MQNVVDARSRPKGFSASSVPPEGDDSLRLPSITNPIAVGPGVVVGGTALTIIAGPCSVEGRGMINDTACAVRRMGAHALRGGAYKPRTSPHSFQGMGDAALDLLAEARAESGLPIVS